MLRCSSPEKNPITDSKRPRFRLRFYRGILICFFSALHLNVAVGAEASTPFIQGYTNQRSYAPGDRIDFHISSRLDRYTITIRRLGSVQQPIFKKTIENMLLRPEMHAQSVASLEDQFTLLCSFIDYNHLDRYNLFVHNRFGYFTPASHWVRSFSTMGPFLEKFYIEFVKE